MESLRQAIEGVSLTWDYEYRILKNDGAYVHIAEKGQICRDSEGKAYRMVGGMRNITERNEANEKLRNNKDFLTSMIDHMPIGVLVIDKEGFITQMNGAYKSSFGISINYEVTGNFSIFRDNLSIEPELIGFIEKVKKGGVLVNEEILVDFASPANHWSSRMDKAWFVFTMFPVYSNGEVSAIVSVHNEVTTDKLNQQKIKENTAQIIESNKKLAEYRLMALRSVMNPHFLFNSLNSIQSFVATNEKEQAINYLSLFSKLIRSILNSSIENYTALSEELAMLKLYVNLEKLRFNDKFHVEFVVDKRLNIETEIPSLILQPFVENAILHGLYNKTEFDGKLLIEFKWYAGKILCVIEDNGIGRSAALKIRAGNKLYKSLGMFVTQERLDLLNKENTLSVEVIDLFDHNNLACGTRVQLLIDTK